MKLLVTGGAGFIGSNLTDQLITEGHEVTIIDNLSTGSKKNIHPKAQFIQSDLRDIHKNLKPISFDCVFHLAAQTDVVTSVNDPVKDADINIIQGLELLKYCVQSKVKKIVFSSTCAIYGEVQYLPVDEKHPQKPISGYGNSKLSFEKYLHFFNQVFGLNYTILRYGNVYGPRQQAKLEGGVIAIFVDKMIKNEVPTIFGDGLQTRDFLYVKDIVSANIAAIKHANQNVINIGTKTQTNILDLFQSLKEILDFQLKAHFAPARKGEVQKLYLSNEKASKELQWQPQFNLKSGLKDFIATIQK